MEEETMTGFTEWELYRYFQLHFNPRGKTEDALLDRTAREEKEYRALDKKFNRFRKIFDSKDTD